MSFFGLFGGALAWYLQLCTGYALASGPCFHDGDRLRAPLATLQWTWTAMIAAMGAAVLIALWSLAVSWRAYRRTQDEAQGDSQHLLESGAGRTRFLALWGVFLGSAFAVASAMTAVAFITVPRCAG
jgi:hypothetical protein